MMRVHLGGDSAAAAAALVSLATDGERVVLRPEEADATIAHTDAFWLDPARADEQATAVRAAYAAAGIPPLFDA